MQHLKEHFALFFDFFFFLEYFGILWYFWNFIWNFKDFFELFAVDSTHCTVQPEFSGIFIFTPKSQFRSDFTVVRIDNLTVLRNYSGVKYQAPQSINLLRKVLFFHRNNRFLSTTVTPSVSFILLNYTSGRVG